MNKLVYISIFFLLSGTISACSFTDANGGNYSKQSRLELRSVEDLYRFLTYNKQRLPLISAHRGGPEPGFPENAIETFERSASKQR